MNRGFADAITHDIGSAGGTISGDVTITGDLTVQGSDTYAYDEIIEGNLQVGNSSTADSNIVIESSSSGDPKLQFTATANRSGLIDFVEGSTLQGAIVYKHNGDTLGFSTASTNRTERFVVNETSSYFTSNLGIGVTVPEAQLNIAKAGSSDNAIFYIDTFSSGINNQSIIGLRKSNSNSIGTETTVEDDEKLGKIAWYGGETDGYDEAASIHSEVDGTPGSNDTDMPGALVFSTTADGTGSSTERMRIASDGKVTFTQDVSGDAYIQVQNIIGGSSSVDETAGIRFSLGDGSALRGGGKITTKKELDFTTSANMDTSMMFSVLQNNGWNDALFISSAGNVGIGESEPDKMLHLKSSGSESPCIKIENNNDDQYPPRIQFVKDVGSGAEADYDQLGSISFRGQDTNNNLGTFTRIVGKSLDVTDSTEDGQLVIDVMKNNDADGVQVFIDAVGMDIYGTPLKVFGSNVGHETSALCISQDTSALSQIRAYGADDSTAGTLEFRMTSSAGAVNQGVMKLDVNSRISLTNNDNGGTSGSDSLSANTIFGYLAGEDITTGGVDNTYFGHKAGSNNATGDDNTFIGSNAGKGVNGNSNEDNTGIGSDCMLAITTGTRNTAVGRGAGDNLSTVNRTVLIGDSAGSGVMTTNASASIPSYADGTVAIGYAALYANTTGFANVAIGYKALEDNQTGAYNTAVGYTALSNTTNNYNTAVGYASLVSTVGGGGNTAVGHESLYANASTSNNTGVGYQAGFYTTGADNTYLGYSAGKGASGADASNVGIGKEALKVISSGSENVAIGKTAMEDANTAAGNVAIGTECLMNLTDGTNNVAIGKVALNGSGVNPSSSTAVGYAASRYAEGSNNVSLGHSALKGVSGFDGNNNVAIGYEAMDAVTDGEEANIAIGYGSMGAVNESSSHHADANIAIGYNALTGGTLTDGNLSHNIAIGYEALDATGANDQLGTIAIGYAALGALTSGGSNTAIGYEAMLYQTDGANNVALGYKALRNADNGESLNTVIGTKACEFLNHASSDGNTIVGTQANVGGTGARTYNTAMGYRAMGSGNTQNNIGADENVFIGAFSGNGTWTGDTSNYNTAIGAYTMDANLDGALYNVAVGYQALSTQTSGDYNTVVGGQAGLDQTTAAANSFYGFRAGYDIIGGGENTFIGSGAGLLTTAVVGATLIGREAGGGGIITTAANHTTAVGYQALYGLTSGARNTAIGSYSLDGITTSNDNTAVGYNALTACGDSYSNTALGSGAGATIANSGAFNVCIGKGADVSAGAATSQIAIGYAKTATQNHETVIGESIWKTVTKSVTCTLGGDDANDPAHTAAICKIPQYAVITKACALVTQLSNQGNHTLKLCLSTDSSGTDGTVLNNVQDLISTSVECWSGRAADGTDNGIDVSSGGTNKVGYAASALGTDTALSTLDTTSADLYVYLAFNDSNYSGSDTDPTTAPIVEVLIEYVGMD